MQHMRQIIDEEFHKVYKQSERLAEKLHIEPTIPRSAVKQMYRNKSPAENPEEYYWRAPGIEGLIKQYSDDQPNTYVIEIMEKKMEQSRKIW